jgi:hypothetical protein
MATMLGDKESKFDIWRILITIVILGAIAGGLWLHDAAGRARYDALQAQVRSSTESIMEEIRINRSYLQTVIERRNSAEPAPAAPPPAEPAPEPAPEGDQPPPSGE